LGSTPPPPPHMCVCVCVRVCVVGRSYREESKEVDITELTLRSGKGNLVVRCWRRLGTRKMSSKPWTHIWGPGPSPYFQPANLLRDPCDSFRTRLAEAVSPVRIARNSKLLEQHLVTWNERASLRECFSNIFSRAPLSQTKYVRVPRCTKNLNNGQRILSGSWSSGMIHWLAGLNSSKPLTNKTTKLWKFRKFYCSNWKFCKLTFILQHFKILIKHQNKIIKHEIHLKYFHISSA
jgi:hypothetical protein